MKILLIIFLIFVFGLILIFSVLRGVVSLILGKGSFKARQQAGSYGQNQQSQSNNSREDSDKVFSPNEGEYIKYEEIE